MAAHRGIQPVGSQTRTNTVFTPPAGVEVGDVILIDIVVGASALVTPTAPAGFTLVESQSFSEAAGYTIFHGVWRKLYAGETSWTWTHASATSQGACIAASAIDAAVLDVPATKASQNELVGGGGVPNITLPGQTTVTANALAYAFRASWEGLPISPPTDWTELLDSSSLWVGTRLWGAAGPTGDVAIASGNNAVDLPRGGILVSLRPGVAATPLATPTVTITAENDPSTIGGSDGSIVGTYTTVPNADRYEIGIRTGHGQTTGFTQVDDDGPTPFTITGRVAGDYTVGVRAHPAS